MKKIAVLSTLLLVSTHGALASSWCPTKSEARDMYGGRHTHLFWHTEHRCWDNRRRNVHHWPHSHHEVASRAEAVRAVNEVATPKPRPEPVIEAEPESVFPTPQIGFSIRWPDTETLSPLKWLRELFEFGEK